MSKETRHYEDNTLVPASPEKVFSYADDHSNFSAHMSKSSWMMAGGHMEVTTDEGHGQKVDSHIRLSGKVIGISLFLDEVVTQHDSPYRKTWQTVGDINLLVIGHYKMGFEIKPEDSNSRFQVFIDYELPKSFPTRWLGYLFGGMYAKWCVNQMIKGVSEHFAN
ncbi:SRPBCC family protein [Patescibacteria group bacterium]|nr:SRPBCC family protein [Patescibacteria group bacterium]